ncbi:MAG: class II aldolase/adducin family protein [Candidatus Magasanikbacteria bacterium]
MHQSAAKFKTEFIHRVVPADIRIIELRCWARIFSEKGLTPFKDGFFCGNLSFRLNSRENRFIITASQIGIQENLPDSGFVLVENCDFDSGVVKVIGLRDPSSESFLHSAIYLARPEVNFIFHGHSNKILANVDNLNLVVTNTSPPYGTVAFARSALEVLGQNNFIIMRDHGFVALGKTADEAGKYAIEVLERI